MVAMMVIPGESDDAFQSAVSAHTSLPRQEILDRGQDNIGFFLVRNMTATLQDKRPGRPMRQTHNLVGMDLRAIFVAISMDRKNRTLNTAEIVIDTPIRKARRKPALRPGVEHPLRLVSMLPH